MRKDVEWLRDELRQLDATIDMMKEQLRGLRDELWCVEIYEKRKVDL